MIIVQGVSKSNYEELIEIWEASVRASHHFLKEEDILYFKPLILEKYFDAVQLRCVKDEEGKILGFSGVAKQNLEMLFVDPKHFRKGIGKVLLDHSIKESGIIYVDVNEENPHAYQFYLKNGFEVFERSAQDATGRPYPILHMKRKEIPEK